MAHLRYENLWKLLTKFNFILNNEICDEFICVICEKILKNAYQGPCGCRYCMECIEQYLNEKEERCPGKMEDCKELKIRFGDLQIDYVINKKISIMKMNCPIENCQFSCDLKSMNEHINSHETKCPYYIIGCDTAITGVTSITNQNNCNMFHHAELLIAYIDELKKEVYQLKESLKLAEVDSEKKNELLIGLNERLNGVINTRVNEKEIPKENEELQFEIVTLKTSESVCWNEIDDKNDDVKVSATPLVDVDLSPVATVFEMNSGVWKWRVTNLKRRILEASRGQNRCVTSKAFYSHVNGYKMCMTVYPNGTGLGKSSHVSAYIHIMRGEHDDKLPWPMQGEMKLSIPDQIYGNLYVNHRYSYLSTKWSYIFNKPTCYMNNGIGESQLIPLSTLLNNPRIYKNDSIILRCSFLF